MALPRFPFNPDQPIPSGSFSVPEIYTVESDPSQYIVGFGLSVDPLSGVMSITPGETGTVSAIYTGEGLIGGPITFSGTISLAPSGVIPGEYTTPKLTVDSYGRITTIADSPIATTTTTGVIQIATYFEVQAGSDTNKAVTPASLQSIKSDSVSTVSSTRLATSTAVKTAYDKAVEAISIAGDITAEFTNKGDILAGTGPAAFTALPVGIDGQTLKACSACATGLTWDADATGADIPCSVITAQGDIIAGSAGTAPSTLSVGTEGQFLKVCGTAPLGITWAEVILPGSATPVVEGLVFGCTTTTTNMSLGFSALASNTIGVSNTAVGVSSLLANTSGSRNTSLGTNTLFNSVSGTANTAIGHSVLLNNSTGSFNSALGDLALYTSSIGSCNTAVGACSAHYNTDGNFNTSVGYCAGFSNSSGASNTSVGSFALRDTQGSGNVAIGTGAAQSVTSGNFFTGVGYQAFGAASGAGGGTALGAYALERNSSGAGNTGIGCQSLRCNTLGSSNTATGACSLYSNFSGIQNTSIGFNSSFSNTTGANNAAVGHNALFSNISGSNNVSLGACSGSSLNNGNNNTFLGYCAGTGVITGSDNIIIGNPGTVPNQSCNIYIGVSGNCTRLRINESGAWSINGTANFGTTGQFLQSNGTGSAPTWVNPPSGGTAAQPLTRGTLYGTSGEGTACNTAVGYGAAANNSVGVGNSSLGANALGNATGGNYNVAVGLCSMDQASAGDANVAVGAFSLRCSTGIQNTAVGTESLSNSTSGICNTALGFCSLRSNTTGNTNVAIGHTSMFANTSGSFNLAIGVSSLAFNTTGNGNIAMGEGALFANTTGCESIGIGIGAIQSATCTCRHLAVGNGALNSWNSNPILYSYGNTAIGHLSLASLTAGANNIALGEGSGNDALCSLGTQNNHVIIGNNATANTVVKVDWTVGSDVRYKNVVGNVPLALDFVKSLNPITYQWCDPTTSEVTDDRYRYGFSAQEVMENEEHPEHPIIVNANDPDFYKMQTSALIPVLVNAIKELSAQVEELRAEKAAGG